MVSEIINAFRAEIPRFTAAMPKPKDTEKYPRAIGIPFDIPFAKGDFTFRTSFHFNSVMILTQTV